MNELDGLREMVRNLFDGRASSEHVRAALDTPDGYDTNLWQTVAELDLLGLLVPEQFGGVGAGLPEIAVVLHEIGRRTVPLPIVSSAVLAPTALLHGDNQSLAAEMLPALATGERRAAVVVGGPDGELTPAVWALKWGERRGDYVLNGVAGFVLDAPGADDLIVAARGEDGLLVAAVDAREAAVIAAATTDRTRRLGTVTLDGAAVPAARVLARGDAAGALVARVQAVAAFAIACDAVGLAERTMERTASYAQVRQQFGRAIGSFQAIKHKCADMAVAVECSRAALSLALDALRGRPDEQDGPADVAAVSTAKAYACDAAVTVCGDAIQAHGGIGFTWEHDAHLWLKRALLDRALFGSPSWHRRRVADAVLPTETALANG
ncbi:acyl-CoA dehydrogenase family protein [Mycobacterium sp.]|uniref:acyl-CoA dehydrogenase family protein n=1 Tax=Mycobacterium sp. TaxID=1785 RepID=UPI001204E89E|nr:acyl-CoA dehydrogenase family protein [Mycobacterium sp.]TAM64457.1 MAG: acyl-CoA dehydrogenase [Mycobacterium sp.]